MAEGGGPRETLFSNLDGEEISLECDEAPPSVDLPEKGLRFGYTPKPKAEYLEIRTGGTLSSDNQVQFLTESKSEVEEITSALQSASISQNRTEHKVVRSSEDELPSNKDTLYEASESKVFGDNECEDNLSLQSQSVKKELLEKCMSEVTNQAAESADSVAFCDIDGDTPLHMAVIFDINISLFFLHIQYLCEKFAYMDIDFIINFQNRMFQTALHLAVSVCRVDIVKLLLDLGARTDLRDNHLRTPVFRACEMVCSWPEKANICESFFQPERSPLPSTLDIVNDEGETCLHLAVRNGNVRLTSMLLKAGAGINVSDRKTGLTALHMAAMRGDARMLELLLSSPYVDKSAHTYNHLTPLNLAEIYQHHEAVQLLQQSYTCEELEADKKEWEDEDND